jgi:multisubunit Na+/H+ antiporter MnhF subunit
MFSKSCNLASSNQDGGGTTGCKSSKQGSKKLSQSDSFKSVKDSEAEKECKPISPTLAKIIQKEQTHFKPASYVLVPTILVGLLLLTFLKGNSILDSIIGVEQCSSMDFTFLAILVLFLITITVINIILVKREYKAKVDNDYTFVDGDLKWTPESLVGFILSAIGAGSVAGVFGLGGGIIFKPLLLHFKVSPVVAASTGMYMIMFTTFSNSIIFYVSGYLNLNYGLW